MCARNERGGHVNPQLPLTELSLESLRQILPVDFIRQLSKVYLCGNYGDPIMAKDCAAVFRYFREQNPKLNLGMHTNGGARDVAFWKDLAGSASYVRFGIDGLRDTNHLYRQGVSWDLLERNVRAFIEAGGRAEWDFLVFKHNQHQVEEAKALAAEWGIQSFNIKTTSRFFSTHQQKLLPSVQVRNAQNEPSHELQRTDDVQFENQFYAEQEEIRLRYGSLQNYWDQTQISCRVGLEKSLYLSADGLALPCCWVGNEVHSKFFDPTKNQLKRMLLELPEKDDPLNALKHGLQAVVEGNFFQSALPTSWERKSLDDGKLKVCARTCGQGLRPFEAQFQ
jgi:MoaA/NifB/PqqE/SkfB family radical SAM enzyme